MKISTDRILTTHCGSLPRPANLLDLMKIKIAGPDHDEGRFAERVHGAVRDIVKKQVDCGIDVPTDGEQGKPGFFAYVAERLAGFEARSGPRPTMFAAETEAFP